ncbi:MAG: hypothetical protein KAU17_00875 [Spirochaetales bacterium]|jgi:hypothetical protein|nr:hypothetical protein [Spirochaetales bacterium]
MPRGRPRKNPEPTVAEEPKKRGRPPKNTEPTVAEAPKKRGRKETSETGPVIPSALEKKYEKLMKQELKHTEAQIKQLLKHRSFLMKELCIPEEE